jgi:hypothetical protein
VALTERVSTVKCEGAKFLPQSLLILVDRVFSNLYCLLSARSTFLIFTLLFFSDVVNYLQQYLKKTI